MKKFLAVLFSVVILATLLAVPAFAAVSPSGDVYHTVEIKGGTTTEVKDGDSITLTPSKPDADFEKWVIEGEYDVVSGDVNSKEFVIVPKSDLVIEEVYADEVIVDKEENDSDKAPQTGNGVVAMVALLTAGAFVAMVATRKAVRS